jgi:L-lysine 6-transaminase
MATSRIDEVKDNVFQVSSRINSTWGANLVDFVRAKRFLEIIEEDKLVENSAQVGEYLLQRLNELEKKYPGRIFNVRGKGLHCAFDVSSPEMCGKVKSLAYELGALIISCGTATIRFRPFLDIKKEDIDNLIKILDEVFARLGKSAL